jgi:hypothetical protein
MEGLGRVFNVVPAANGLYISMETCSAISFVCTSAGSDSFNFAEAKDSAGTGVQDISPLITHYYDAADTDGSVAWTKTTQAAADETGTITTGHCAVVTIHTSYLDDGFDYVSCTASSSGTVIAILHDLIVQRTPANLALPGE